MLHGEKYKDRLRWHHVDILSIVTDYIFIFKEKYLHFRLYELFAVLFKVKELLSLRALF